PFCQKSSADHCEHLVLGQDSTYGWVYVPVDECELPWLDDDGASSDAGGDGEIRAVFGELVPLVAFESLGDFYTRLAPLMATPVVLCEGINVMAIYSEHHRDEARAEVGAIIRRLADGFERLAVRRRSPCGVESHA